MDRLPNEILRSIFAYLRVSDLVQVRSTCRAVCGAATWMLCQKMTVVVQSGEKQQNLIDLLESGTVSPLFVENLEYFATERSLNELSTLLPYLSRLVEFECTFYPNVRSNAEDLDLLPLSRLFALPELRYLILEMYDHHVQRLLSKMQPSMVTRLNLQGLSYKYTTPISMSSIAKCMPALKGLFLCYFRLDGFDGNIGLPSLNCLHLADCTGVTSAGLEQFLQKCPSVQRLSLFCNHEYRPFGFPDRTNMWVAPLTSLLQDEWEDDEWADDGCVVWWSLPLENLEYACMDTQAEWNLEMPRVHIVLQDVSLAVGAPARVYVRRALGESDDWYKELSATDTETLFNFLIGLLAGRDDWTDGEWDPDVEEDRILQPIEIAKGCLRRCLITVTTCGSVKSCKFYLDMPRNHTFDFHIDE
ncbi:hypothetical protein BC940DRAFT_365293 [Gongronella butleri]|nr:hypothetical protein BC940DRAFT_365293 [Gongronella butleri]